ncbi:CorA-like Mg2+ transporter protein, putative [Plasmodium ovale wallikeri]|uniref:Magnesium transporter n=2 Tax=Plasmodium ovale TaxID=36330 RepID=A0A1A8ZPU0_PLAOA|nr:CorA-like Mg2+ transporter protein, putative [Plasmodium ovale wallikeri]SBT45841.1 CorA-like Mg2+ transporter protein, putative [Plasmodium ovale wallikeri]
MMPEEKKLNKPLLNMSDNDGEIKEHGDAEEHQGKVGVSSHFHASHQDMKNLMNKNEQKMKGENVYMDYLKSRFKRNGNSEFPKYNSILEEEQSKEEKGSFFNKKLFSYMKENKIVISDGTEQNIKNDDFKVRIKCFNKYLKHYVHKISNGETVQYSLQTHELLKIVHQIKGEKNTPINSSGLAQYRDIRQLLSSHSNTRFDISPKRNCVLINLPYRKCIIFKDFLLYIPTFTSSPIPEIAEKEDKMCKYFIENAKMISLIKDSLPFEILILEAIFVDICEELKNEIEPVICEAEKLFEIISNNLSIYKCINKLTDMRRKLKIIDEKVQSVYKAIHAVLNNDEDIRRLEVSYFGDKPELWEKCNPTPNNEDTEMLLEYYCHEIEEFLKIIHRTDQSLDDVLQMVELNLDDARNNVLKLELGLKIYGIIITVVGTVAAIFGMNLKNGFESDQYVFWTLAFSLMLITVFCLFYVIVSFKKVNI